VRSDSTVSRASHGVSGVADAEDGPQKARGVSGDCDRHDAVYLSTSMGQDRIGAKKIIGSCEGDMLRTQLRSCAPGGSMNRLTPLHCDSRSPKRY